MNHTKLEIDGANAPTLTPKRRARPKTRKTPAAGFKVLGRTEVGWLNVHKAQPGSAVREHRMCSLSEQQPWEAQLVYGETEWSSNSQVKHLVVEYEHKMLVALYAPVNLLLLRFSIASP